MEEYYLDGIDMSSNKLCAFNIYDKYYMPVSEIDLNSDVQRGEVWSTKRKSGYIHSMLLGIVEAQSPFVINVITDEAKRKIFRVIDGKQRTLAITRYIHGEYKLTGLKDEPTIIDRDGTHVNLQGKRFVDLPINFQNKIKLTNINIAFMYNATPEQEALVFRRLNSGQAVSKFDLACSYKQGQEDIRELKKHELFNVMFNEKQINAYKPREIIVKSWIALYEDEPNLAKKHVDEVMKMLSIDDGEREQIEQAYDFIFDTYKILNVDDENELIKIMFRPTHFVGYLPFIDRFDSPKQFSDWAKVFFGNMPEDYASLVREHTTSPTSIKARREIIKRSIDEFLGK